MRYVLPLGIQVTSVDFDVINRVASLVKKEANAIKNYTYEKSLPNRQQQYRVRIYGSDALKLMITLKPVMGKRRQEQIDKALQLCYRLAKLAGGLDNQD